RLLVADVESKKVAPRRVAAPFNAGFTALSRSSRNRSGMTREVGTYRFIDCCKERFVAKACKKPKAFQLILDWVLHLCKTQLDTSGVQFVVELADRIRRSDVDTRDRLCCDHDPFSEGR